MDIELEVEDVKKQRGKECPKANSIDKMYDFDSGAEE